MPSGSWRSSGYWRRRRRAPAEAAGREEEAREARRFVEEVEPLLAEAERQMGAKEFAAAVVTLRTALALDGASMLHFTLSPWRVP